MIRFFTIFMMIICFWFCTIPAAAQSANSSPLTLGVGIGGMNGNKQFDGNTEFQFRVFLRHYYSEYVQGEFGAGLGMISDSWYDSHLYPFDYRLLFTPEFYDEWTPYMYMGFGFVGYDVTRTDYQYLPSYLSPSYKRSGMSG